MSFIEEETQRVPDSSKRSPWSSIVAQKVRMTAPKKREPAQFFRNDDREIVISDSIQFFMNAVFISQAIMALAALVRSCRAPVTLLPRIMGQCASPITQPSASPIRPIHLRRLECSPDIENQRRNRQ
jgi:hypothetical protein